MELANTEKLTTWLLRIIGGSICLAFFPIFFPIGWMETIHGWLGLGEIPGQPIFEYLARSLSAMFFAHGAMVLAISTDVRRYRPLVAVTGALNVLLGAVFLGIDLAAEMPWFWTLAEGPPITAIGLLLLWLWQQSSKAQTA